MILSSSWVKIHQIPYVNLETASQFLFRFFIILQCHYLWLLCKFVAYAFSTLNKRIPWKYQFWHFQVFWWKFAKFLMSFSKPQVSFSWNFAWLFSIMKYNSPVLFKVERCILCAKGTNQSATFLDFLVLRSKFTKFLSFSKQKISLPSNFAPLSLCALGYQSPSKTPPSLSCQAPL